MRVFRQAARCLLPIVVVATSCTDATAPRYGSLGLMYSGQGSAGSMNWWMDARGRPHEWRFPVIYESSPLLSEDGWHLYFVEFDTSLPYAVSRASPKGDSLQYLNGTTASVGLVGLAALNPDGGIIGLSTESYAGTAGVAIFDLGLGEFQVVEGNAVGAIGGRGGDDPGFIGDEVLPPVWTRDDRLLYFALADSTADSRNLAGAVTRIPLSRFQAGAYSEAAWSPGGDAIALATADSVLVFDTAGTPIARFLATDSWIVWEADGRAIIATTRPPANAVVSRLDPATGATAVLSTEAGTAMHPPLVDSFGGISYCVWDRAANTFHGIYLDRSYGRIQVPGDRVLVSPVAFH